MLPRYVPCYKVFPKDSNVNVGDEFEIDLTTTPLGENYGITFDISLENYLDDTSIVIASVSIPKYIPIIQCKKTYRTSWLKVDFIHNYSSDIILGRLYNAFMNSSCSVHVDNNRLLKSFNHCEKYLRLWFKHPSCIFFEKRWDKYVSYIEIIILDPTIDIKMKDSLSSYGDMQCLFECAIILNMIELVQDLICSHDDYVHPMRISYEDNPSVWAACNNNKEMVDLVLGDSRMVHVRKQRLLWGASRYGHTRIVSRLLDYDDVSNNLESIESSLSCATDNGYLDIVILLMRYSRTSPNDIFREAAINNDFNIVQYFVETLGVDPSLGDNWALDAATRYNNFEMIHYLLLVPNVRQAIHKSRYATHKKRLQRWIKSYVKKKLTLYITIESWRLVSVYSVYV